MTLQRAQTRSAQVSGVWTGKTTTSTRSPTSWDLDPQVPSWHWAGPPLGVAVPLWIPVLGVCFINPQWETPLYFNKETVISNSKKKSVRK